MNLDLPIQVRGNPVLTSTQFYNETLFQVDGWSHRIAARKGFDRASFSLSGERLYLVDWFEHGLLRDVTRYDQYGNIMWQGYVHSLTLTLPGIQYTLSIEHLANNVFAIYAPTDFSGPIPISGEPTITSPVADSTSQSLYGLSQHIVNAGNVLVATANALRDVHFIKYKYPTRTPRALAGSDFRLHVECRGYGDWFRRRYYTSITTGTANASTIVTNISSQVGQFIAATSIDTNTLPTSQYYSNIQQELSYDVLNAIADAGDGTVRWNWGVYEDRTLYFKAVPTGYEYVTYLSDPHQKVYTTTGLTVEPWQMRPDKFIRIPDLEVLSIARNVDMTIDLQVQYINAVSWNEDSPYKREIEYLEGDELASLLSGLTARGERL